MIAGAVALVAFAFVGDTFAGHASPSAPPPRPTAVSVERVRPRKEARPTLRFLKANRDFFRSQLDLLREQPLALRAGARDIDPRFLAYRAMMNDALAATDSLDRTAGDRERHAALSGAGGIASLEGELDQMDRVLANGRARLAALQADFSGSQRTALAIVVSGYPQGAELDSLSIRFDDGSTCQVAVSREARESLLHRGVLEVFHGLIEPREQVLEVSVVGQRLAGRAAGYVTVDPRRDRLTFLQLELSAVRPATGAPAILASTWLNDDALSANGETSKHP